MDVYVLLSDYYGEIYMEMVLHIPKTNIWLTNNSSSGENLEESHFTEKFWRCVDEMQENYLIKLGRL